MNYLLISLSSVLKCLGNFRTGIYVIRGPMYKVIAFSSQWKFNLINLELWDKHFPVSGY